MAGQFKVISQKQSLRIMADGSFQDVMEVTFETLPSHAVGTENFPLNDYKPEYVAEVLAARAGVMEAVKEL